MSTPGRRPHNYDDDGCCVVCGFDGVDHYWQMKILRSEIGEDEFNYRKSIGDFDYGFWCKKAKKRTKVL